ncbi:MAG: 30S ribosomal protein S19e [Candidatus Woesearchaeota archaeon]
MVRIHDVNQQTLVTQAAESLKKDKAVSMPEWAQFVKTGISKQRAPLQDDWWYIRAGSVLKRIYTHGPIGVSKLRTHYGSKKNRGVRPEKFQKSSGKIIRVILQQLEAGKYITNEEKGLHKGRKITPKGVSLLDKAAGAIHTKERPAQKTQEVKEQ